MREREEKREYLLSQYKGICLTNLYWDNTYYDSDSLTRERERERERIFIVPVQIYKEICLINLYWDNKCSDSDSLTREREGERERERERIYRPRTSL